MSNKMRKIFLLAANHLEHHGWCQHQLEMPDGSTCMVGALGYWSNTLSEYQRALASLENMLVGSPTEWNDRKGRSKQEVIDALVAAAYW